MIFIQEAGSHYLVEVIGSLIDTKTWITDQITLGIYEHAPVLESTLTVWLTVSMLEHKNLTV
jgi:hypothetical protein